MHVQIILPSIYNLFCQRKCCRSSCQARHDKQTCNCVPGKNARGVWQLCTCKEFYQAYTICSSNGKACKVIVRRSKTNRLATASQERTQGESSDFTAPVKYVAAVLCACDVLQPKSSLGIHRDSCKSNY